MTDNHITADAWQAELDRVVSQYKHTPRITAQQVEAIDYALAQGVKWENIPVVMEHMFGSKAVVNTWKSRHHYFKKGHDNASL